MADKLKVWFLIRTLLGPQFIIMNMQVFFSIKKVICSMLHSGESQMLIYYSYFHILGGKVSNELNI